MRIDHPDRDDPMPPELDLPSLSKNDLLNAYATAIGWVDNCYNTRMAKAWEKRCKDARKEVLKRMKS